MIKSAEEIVDILNSDQGGEYKSAIFTSMVWDKGRYAPGTAKVITVNKGNGFADAVQVPQTTGGNMLYFAPYRVDNEPTETVLFLFTCSDMLFIK